MATRAPVARHCGSTRHAGSAIEKIGSAAIPSTDNTHTQCLADAEVDRRISDVIIHASAITRTDFTPQSMSCGSANADARFNSSTPWDNVAAVMA